MEPRYRSRGAGTVRSESNGVAASLRVGEVAELTGVSVRTLHHYDEIGLLRPTGHSEGGHRLYAEQDLLDLQQILTLRYLGFPLKQIGQLLKRPDFDLVASMRIQRGALRDRISELERIDAALGELVEQRLATGRWAWDLVVRASTAVQGGLAQKEQNVNRYYTPEQMQQFNELRERVPAEEIKAIEDGWTALLKEVRANRHLDPASAKAQELADRWHELTERTVSHYRDHPELSEAIANNYHENRFEGFDRAPQAEDFGFIQKVDAARQGKAGQ